MSLTAVYTNSADEKFFMQRFRREKRSHVQNLFLTNMVPEMTENVSPGDVCSVDGIQRAGNKVDAVVFGTSPVFFGAAGLCQTEQKMAQSTASVFSAQPFFPRK